MQKLNNPALRFPRATILLCLAVFCAAALGIFQFRLSYDTRVFFNPEGSDLSTLRDFESKYGQNNDLLMVVWAGGRKVTEPDVLAALGDLVERAWTLPHSTRVDSLTNFPHVIADQDAFSVADLVPEPADTTETEAREIERLALDDPLILNRLLASDARATGVVVNFNLPPEASAEVREIVSAARTLVTEFEKENPGLEVKLTGNVILMATFSEAAMSDVTYLIPISLVVTAIVMFVFVRAVLPSLAILSLLGLSSAAAMGVAGWYGYEINTATVACPIIIMTVNMAAAVRIVTTALGALGRGLSRQAAIGEAVSMNLWPVTLTNATTIVGFLAMNLADAPPLRQQGNIVVLGICIAYVFTFTWLPAVLSLMPLRPAVQRSERFMVLLGRFVNRYYKQLFFLCSVVVVSCAIWLGNIRLDDDFARYFDQRFEYRQDSDFTEERLTGLNIVEFDIESGESGGVFEPAYQRRLAEFETWLRGQPGVVSVAAVSDITRRVHDAMNAGRDTDGSLPDSRETIAQYFLLYELSLPFGASLNDQIDVSRSSSRVTVILRHMSSSEIRGFNARAAAWLSENVPPEMRTQGTGLNVLFANLSGINVRSMMLATLISILVIAVVVGIALRSAVFGALSILLNMLPSLVGFGLWGLLYQDIGLAASVVTAMTIGLVVDDTIYFLLMYQQARERGLNPEGAINHVFATVGVAMLVITVSLTIGFGTLAFSGFEVNRSLGAMTALVILSNLFIDWLMLPPVMRILENSRARAKRSGPS
ncbi:MMPL family transporter [Parvibaculum sp.]|uniref:efflux RND transporter permease subunit n=1 Tax=Parvibaculum sp. TaxID=2024848 RepID=UPI001B257C30|nr:MMPL family transporter [Parvibaculum sp.]MBO6678807.1 MMPL family transporter [Parvibaculum sp.]MBO6684841.1 MMPL family transporter [Parvibaculum sp.]